MGSCISMIVIVCKRIKRIYIELLGALLLTQINLNPSMNKLSHAQYNVGKIAYPFNGCVVEVWKGMNNLIPHFNWCDYLDLS